MTLFAQLKHFGNDESGAVTVDWVVLTRVSLVSAFWFLPRSPQACRPPVRT